MREATARPAAPVAERRGISTRLRGVLERESILAYLFMTPGAILLFLFMAYPFFLGIYLSMTDKMIGFPESNFVGLDNYRALLRDSIFRQTVVNTLTYGFLTVPAKLVLGMLLALLLNNRFPFQKALRAGLLLPWIVPTALSSLAWLMLFDGVLSPLSWTLKDLGLIEQNISFLGEKWNAIASICVANIWRGTPFFAVAILAGLQAVPDELHEAAAIDGANAFQRFWAVTWPVIRGVVLIASLFSIIWTFADFQLVYVLTKGGPANQTHIFGTYAYNIGVGGVGDIGMAAAISLFMLPFLAIFSFFLLLYVRRGD